MHGVTLKQYSVGVRVGHACSGEISHCRFMGDVGLDAHSKRTAMEELPRLGDVVHHSTAVALLSRSGSVRDCQFTGNVCCVIANADEVVQIVGCSFRVPSTWPRAGRQERAIRAKRGACVRLASKAEVEDCEFTSGPFAIAAQGARAVCAVRRCTFDGGVQIGIGAMAEARVVVAGSAATCRSAALHADGGAAIVAQDCVCAGGDTALRVGVSGGTIAAERVEARGEDYAALASGGEPRRCRMNLVDCELAGEEAAVRAAGSGVEVSLLRCSVLRSRTGVVVHGGAVARVRDSRISRCVFGVVIGERDEDVRARCHACGCSGAEALELAWSARSRTATCTPGERGCVHMGARAQATLDSVDVRRCQDIGVAVTAFGHVAARAVRVSGGRLGFRLTSWAGAEVSRLTDCTAVVYAVPEMDGGAVEERRGALALMQTSSGERNAAAEPAVEGVRVVREEEKKESEDGGSGGE